MPQQQQKPTPPATTTAAPESSGKAAVAPVGDNAFKAGQLPLPAAPTETSFWDWFDGTFTDTAESKSTAGSSTRTAVTKSGPLSESGSTTVERTDGDRTRTAGTSWGFSLADMAYSWGSETSDVTKSEVEGEEQITDGRSSKRDGSIDADVLGGSIAWGDTQTDTRTIDGEEMSDSRARSSTVTAGGGGLKLGQSSKDSHSVQVGDETFTSSEATDISGGLVANGDGEYGLGGDFAHTVENDEGSSGASAGGQLTNNTLGLHGGLAGSSKAKHETASGVALAGEAKASVGLDGKVTLKQIPVPDSDPPVADLVLTVVAGGTAGIGASGEAAHEKSAASASGSVSGEVGGSATLVFSHRMAQSEAEAYSAKVDALKGGGQATGEYPEFGVIEKVWAASQRLDGASALFDAGSAGTLSPGNTVSITVEGHVKASAEGEVGFQGASVGGGASGSMAQTQTVSLSGTTNELGQRRIQVSVGFTDARSAEVSGKMGAEGVTAGITEGSESSSGQTVVFTLDPESEAYAAQYDLILSAKSAQEAKALAEDPRLADVVQSRTAAEGAGTKEDVQMGWGGLLLKIWDYATTEDSVTVDETGVSADITGTASEGASLEAFGVNAGTGQVDTKFAAKADAEGLSVVVGSEASGNAVGGSDAASMSGEDLLTQEATESVSKAMTAAWAEVRTQTSLTDAQVRLVFARAGDKAKWTAISGGSMDATLAFWALRSEIVSPSADPELAAIDSQRADDIARLKALAAFTAEYGDDAMDALRGLFDDYGLVQAGDAGDENLGQNESWPASLMANREDYDALKVDVPALISAASDPDGGTERIGAIKGRLSAQWDAIAECADFEDTRAQSQMLEQISAWQRDVAQIEYAVGIDPELESPAASDLRVQLEEISRLERLLEVNKAAETQRFDRVRTRTNPQSFMESMFTGASTEEAVEVMDLLEELWETWIGQIKRLRVLYAATGTDNAPVCSLSPADPRNPDVEPDIDTAIELWKAITQDNSWQGATASYAKRFQQY